MDASEIRNLGGGANQTGARAHNERLIMSIIQRHGEMPGMDIAKFTGLSPQTVSNILRKLEGEGFLRRGVPKRGRVGKPSLPMALDPEGAISFGLKIGRRSAELALMNMRGEVIDQTQATYRYPMPGDIFTYLADGMSDLAKPLSEKQRKRICGIGIAAPSELWSWVDVFGAPVDFTVWRDTDFAQEVARISDLQLFSENDATAACRAEHFFGRGREFVDYAYVFIGSFIGGGVVLNSSVQVGGNSNAGAFGSLRVLKPDGSEAALLDAASLYLLEAAISASGGDTATMWAQPQDWSTLEPWLAPWIEDTAAALAQAIRSIASVLDFEAVLIDGAFPPEVRQRLVAGTRRELKKLDMRGLTVPQPEPAQVGRNARVLGAAAAPIYAQYFFK